MQGNHATHCSISPAHDDKYRVERDVKDPDPSLIKPFGNIHERWSGLHVLTKGNDPLSCESVT